MNWDELWQRYSSTGRLRPSTLRGYRKHLNSFLADFPALELCNVQPQHLWDFFAAEQNRQGRGSATRKARAVSIILRWAHRQDLLVCDPCEGFVLHNIAAPMMPILSEEQVARLLDAPSQAKHRFVRARDRAILEVLYGCGLRVGELIGLQMGDIDLGNELVTIRRSKSRPRVVPLGKQAVAALERYILDFRPHKAKAGEMAVWLSSYSGGQLETADVQKQLRLYGRKLGLQGITAHALRRACATHLLEHGANIVDIKTLLGHADINSTLYYAKVFPVELRKAHTQSHPRARSARERR